MVLGWRVPLSDHIFLQIGITVSASAVRRGDVFLCFLSRVGWLLDGPQEATWSEEIEV